MKRVRTFVLNTMLLAATSLLLRTLGVSFSVYLAGVMGAAGMGLLQLIFSVYMLGVTFASSGIRLAATRLTVMEEARSDGRHLGKVMLRIILYALFFGFSAFFLLYLGAPFIAVRFLGEPGAIKALRILSLSLPFVSLSGALGGYFTARRRVGGLACAQICGQLVRVGLSLFFLSLLAHKGLDYACAGVVLGSCLGEMAALTLLFILFLSDDARRQSRGKSPSSVMARLLSIALPDAVSSYVRSSLVTVEHLLIPYGLKRSGASAQSALSSYGTISGMVLPVVLFPYAFLDGMCALLVPEIAECHERRHFKNTNYIIGRVFSMTLLFGLFVMGFLLSLGDDLGMLLYKKEGVGFFIAAIAPLVPVMYLDTAVDSMLKGLGQQTSSMKYNIIDSLFSVAMVWYLLPPLGVTGYIVTIYLAEILNFSLSLRRLIVVTSFRPLIKKWGLIPLFSSLSTVACMGAITAFVYGGVPHSVSGTGVALLGLLSLFIYSAFLWALGGLSSEDAKWVLSIFKKDKGRG